MNEVGARVSVERTFTQDEFDRFAALSGDDNPIHTDPEFAARTRFGRTVAHGIMLYSVLRGLAGRLAPGTRQLSQSLRFPNPTFTGEPMRFEAEIRGRDGATLRVAMKAVRLSDGAVGCEGEAQMSAPEEAVS